MMLEDRCSVHTHVGRARNGIRPEYHVMATVMDCWPGSSHCVWLAEMGYQKKAALKAVNSAATSPLTKVVME